MMTIHYRTTFKTISRNLFLSLALLGFSQTSYATLIGDEITGCVSTFNECGPGFTTSGLFTSMTSTVTDPGNEFNRVFNSVTDQTAADFTADTITLILHDAANNAPFAARYWGFESIDWANTIGGTITGLDLISTTGLLVSSYQVSDNALYFFTPEQIIGLDNTVTATFRINSEHPTQAVSEPATLLLMGLGLLGFSLRRKNASN